MLGRNGRMIVMGRCRGLSSVEGCGAPADRALSHHDVRSQECEILQSHQCRVSTQHGLQ